MTTARVISEADIVPHRAAGYRLENGEVKNQEWVSPTLNTTADGALYFSVSDVIKWDAAVRARAILKPESWNRILQPVTLNSGKTWPYGFGWFLDERGGHPLQQHSGSWQGFKTQLSRFIGEDVSIIVLANLAEANPAKFVDGIAEIMSPKLAVPVPRAIVDLEPAVTSRLTRLLEDARAGTLAPVEFNAMRAGFFPGGAKGIQEQLRTLGPVKTVALVDKTEKGDDRVYTYEVAFPDRTMYYKVALAPDDKVSLFQLREK